MNTTRVREYSKWSEKDGQVQEFDVSSATVELAAGAPGVEPTRITKTISSKDKNGCILIVAAGGGGIGNSVFRRRFGMKARMPVPEETERLTGYRVGEICPLGDPEGARVYLDGSLRRFQTVFPACGTSNSTVELTCGELLECSRAQGWVDVCKGWRERLAEG